MTKYPLHDLEEFKIQASILLKHFRSQNAEQTRQAACRLQCLPQFAHFSIEDVLDLNGRVKRKHALQAIALENQFETWAELKQAHEQLANRHSQLKQKPFAYLYPKRCQGFLNQWFAQYDDAKRYLGQNGGFLLPYDTQYFVCESDYIATLGLNPIEPDWEKIAWDWAEPADYAAWERLNKQLLNYDKKERSSS